MSMTTTETGCLRLTLGAVAEDAAGVGEAALEEGGDWACAATVVPSGPLTETLGISALGAALSDVGAG